MTEPKDLERELVECRKLLEDARAEVERLRRREQDADDQLVWLADWCRCRLGIDNNSVIGRAGWPNRLVEVVARACDDERDRLYKSLGDMLNQFDNAPKQTHCDPELLAVVDRARKVLRETSFEDAENMTPEQVAALAQKVWDAMVMAAPAGPLRMPTAAMAVRFNEAFAEAIHEAVELERQACALIAEEEIYTPWAGPGHRTWKQIANAIRKRGEGL